MHSRFSVTHDLKVNIGKTKVMYVWQPILGAVQSLRCQLDTGGVALYSFVCTDNTSQAINSTPHTSSRDWCTPTTTWCNIPNCHASTELVTMAHHLLDRFDYHGWPCLHLSLVAAESDQRWWCYLCDQHEIEQRNILFLGAWSIMLFKVSSTIHSDCFGPVSINSASRLSFMRTQHRDHIVKIWRWHQEVQLDTTQSMIIYFF